MKNTLLYYQGGGYDGCIWEWNFCFWDADGKWHNLYASGCDGLKTEAEALKLAETLKLKAELVDLTDEERFEKFQQDNNASLVLSIAQELNENYGYSLEVKCFECESNFEANRGEYAEAINNESIVCSECLTLGTCDACSEYVGKTDMLRCDEDGMVVGLNQDYDDDPVGIYLAELGYYAVCSDCFEYNKEQLRLEKLEDLRFKAFCTGKPDIFCDELREFWGA